MMVTKCNPKRFAIVLQSAKAYALTAKERCENIDEKNPFLLTPAFGGDGIVYRNLYCAVCNAQKVIELYDIIYRGCRNNFTIYKDDLDDVFTIDNFFTESTNCTVWIIPRNSKKDLPFQTCKLDRDSELFSKKTFQCNEMERNLCMSFAAMTLSVDSEKVFYNPMCAKCLHGSGHQTTFEQCELAFYKKDDLGWFFTPYSVLISIRRGLTIVKLNKFSESRDIARCNKDNHFDFKKEKCVPIIED